MNSVPVVSVTQNDLQGAIRVLGLSGQAICLHSSLRSFGKVDGGAQAVVQAFLEEGCTLLVPTYSDDYFVMPPPPLQTPRNGWDYEYRLETPSEPKEIKIFTPAAREIDDDMGVISATVMNTPGSVRGNHPINSFSAVGPLAEELIEGQQPLAVYAPLQALVDHSGYVLLMGVGLNSMTLLHLAEEKAGRVLFRRWANDLNGEPQMVEAGSCSDGFEQLAPIVEPWQRDLVVGKSLWHLFPAPQVLQAAAAAIHATPQITHCGKADCERCRDAMLGGPILG